MRLAAGYYGPTNRYGTILSSSAVSQVRLSCRKGVFRRHRRRYDNNNADYWCQIRDEMNI